MKDFMIFSIVFVLLATYVSAADIYTEPPELIFENVFTGVFTSKTVKIMTDRDELTQAVISAPETIKDWMIFEPETIFVRKGSPAEFQLIVLPPYDTPLGTYETYLVINAILENSSLKTSAIAVKTTISVVDKGEIKEKETIEQEEEIPLSINLRMIFFWTVTLVIVTLFISRNEKRHQR